VSYDYKAKGSADFAAKKKDERLFHSGEDCGRLYREGWHAARRAAEPNEPPGTPAAPAPVEPPSDAPASGSEAREQAKGGAERGNGEPTSRPPAPPEPDEIPAPRISPENPGKTQKTASPHETDPEHRQENQVPTPAPLAGTPQTGGAAEAAPQGRPGANGQEGRPDGDLHADLRIRDDRRDTDQGEREASRAGDPRVGSRPPYRVPLMAEIAALPWNGFKVASTFSGCGGSSLGYKIAGFRVLWANEFIPAAQETYRANHRTTILSDKDIRTVGVEEILQALNMKAGELDLLDGSPPCASFSTAGIREDGWGKVKKYSDTEQRTDDLFFEFARILKGLQPKTFVAENVAGLTVGVAKEMLGEGQIDAFETQETTILHTLMDCGYRVGFHVLNAAELGVPQSRRRVIFIGIRKDLATALNLEPKWPRPLPYTYTVRDACPWIARATHNNKGRKSHPGETKDITDAPAPTITVGCSDERGGGVRNHFIVEEESDIARFVIGTEWEKLKPGEQSEKYFSLVRVDPEAPCPTVCASHGAGSIAGITHPYEKRKFSIGELRRICGFPDDFVLTGDYKQQWERLGRSVPPVMMAAIASTVRDEILVRIRDAQPKAEAPPAPLIEALPTAKEPDPASVAIGQLELF
jgi:DNA (cytosine-5)-methyltransferase 1